MNYLELKLTSSGGKVMVPLDSIVYIQDNGNNTTVCAGLATLHVAEKYQDIIEMIDGYRR